MTDRGTGKTFRKVLRALADASEGKSVLFVREDGPEHANRMALQVIKLTLSDEATNISGNGMIIKFPSTNGELKFSATSKDYSMKYKKDLITIYD